MTASAVPPEALERMPIFAGMTPCEREQLLSIATTVEFRPGEVVMRQGKTSQNLLVLLEGECEVVKHIEANADGKAPGHANAPTGDVVLAKLGPTDHFGDMSFFSHSPPPHSASIKAVTPVRLLRFQRHDYDRLIADGSLAAYKLAYNMIEVLSERLRRMDHWVSELVNKTSPDHRPSEWNKFRDTLMNEWNL